MSNRAIAEFIQLLNTELKDLTGLAAVYMSIPVTRINNETYLAINQFRNWLIEKHKDVIQFVHYDEGKIDKVKLYLFLPEEKVDNFLLEIEYVLEVLEQFAKTKKIIPVNHPGVTIYPIYFIDDYELISKVALGLVGDKYQPGPEIARVVDITDAKLIQADMIMIDHACRFTANEFIDFIISFTGTTLFYAVYFNIAEKKSAIMLLIVEKAVLDISDHIASNWVEYSEIISGDVDIQNNISTSVLITEAEFNQVKKSKTGMFNLIMTAAQKHIQSDGEGQ